GQTTTSLRERMFEETSFRNASPPGEEREGRTRVPRCILTLHPARALVRGVTPEAFPLAEAGASRSRLHEYPSAREPEGLVRGEGGGGPRRPPEGARQGARPRRPHHREPDELPQALQPRDHGRDPARQRLVRGGAAGRPRGDLHRAHREGLPGGAALDAGHSLGVTGPGVSRGGAPRSGGGPPRARSAAATARAGRLRDRASRRAGTGSPPARTRRAPRVLPGGPRSAA